MDGHRCPRCGTVRAERRTARSYRERAALAVLGLPPYKCVACDRRFLDRPLARGHVVSDRRPAGEAEAAAADTSAPVSEHAPALVITNGSDVRPARSRRRQRCAVDDGTRPLGRAEIYALVLGALVLVLLALIALRFIWPEAPSGVRPDAG